MIMNKICFLNSKIANVLNNALVITTMKYDCETLHPTWDMVSSKLSKLSNSKH